MDLITLQRVAVDALEDIKAQDIQVYDTQGQTSEFDRVIVASGNSNRQTRSLAWNVVQKVKAAGGQVVSVEGTDSGEWVLVDLGDIVVHIMVPPVRAYYALEEIWGAKPVKAKAVARKPATRKSPTVKAEATKSSAKSAPANKTSTRTAAKKAPARKAAVRKSTAIKKTAAKKSAATKTTATSAAKPAPKSAARSAAAKSSRKTASKTRR